MSKRTLYTNITPLPPQVTRQIALDELHDHGMMIKLNPLVIGFERTTPHKEASPDEFHCTWYEITDRVSYLPGIKGQVRYKACFFDRPIGLQTHCFAPAGLDIKAKWSVGGNMPGEPREARELGIDTPRDGLYLREDVDMHCNIMLTSFVKKNLRNAHSVLVDRLVKKVEFVEDVRYQQSINSSSSIRSSVVTSPVTPSMQPQPYPMHRSDGSVVSDDRSRRGSFAYPNPAIPDQQNFQPPGDDQLKVASPPPLYWRNSGQMSDRRTSYVSQTSQKDSFVKPYSRPQSLQSYAVELPASEPMPAEMYSPPNPPSAPRYSGVRSPPQELESRPTYSQN